jgi:glycosyltransferase involved in cell wall biosynthesis
MTPEGSSAERRTVASYVATFLKPEMLHIYRQIRALENVRPIVFTQKRENADTFPFDDVVVVPKPRTHQLRRVWQKKIRRHPITMYPWEASRFARALRFVEPSVLHIYFGHIGVYLLPFLRKSDLPAIVSFHGADAQVDFGMRAHRRLTRQLLDHIQLVLVRSKSLGARLVETGCSPDKIRLHRTGIPLDESPLHLRHAPGDHAWRCLQACRLIPKKGLRTTLRAFAKFVGTFPRATLTVAGDGPQLEELRSLARNLGVGAQVFFTGFLGQEQLRGLCAESHLFIHPSEMTADGNQEGIPNAMLEAMASGMPVLATQHGGIPEAVEHGVSGLLVREQDDAALAAAMIDLANDPVSYGKMSAAAGARVAAEFDLKKQSRALEAIYEEARTMRGARSVRGEISKKVRG